MGSVGVAVETREVGGAVVGFPAGNGLMQSWVWTVVAAYPILMTRMRSPPRRWIPRRCTGLSGIRVGLRVWATRIAYRRRLVAACATVLLSVRFAPRASAAVPLGGGAGIVVAGSYCTLTTIGHDKTAELVGFTAAHCGGPGAHVVAEGAEDRGTLGTVVATANDARLDYSVIKFDPAAVTPIANFAGFVIKGIDPDPDLRQPVCKLGAATGDFCSSIFSLPGPGPHMSMSGLFQPGDDGAPVTSDNLLIGMVFGGLFVPGDLLGMPSHRFLNLTKFSAILDDVNTSGGPGAGFTPVSA